MKTKTKTYIGIIDDIGLESFFEEQKSIWSKMMYKLRAALNPQRNAKAYQIQLTKRDARKIQAIIDKGYWFKAKKMLTEHANMKYL